MFQKLEGVEARYEELNKLISDPEVISNQAEWKKLMKEHSSIEDVVMKYREYKQARERFWRSKRNDEWSWNERFSRRRNASC